MIQWLAVDQTTVSAIQYQRLENERMSISSKTVSVQLTSASSVVVLPCGADPRRTSGGMPAGECLRGGLFRVSPPENAGM